MKPAIVLFKRDLRLHDNPALSAAAQTKKPLILLYSPESGLGSGQRFWLSRSLAGLQKELAKRKKQLVIRSDLKKAIVQSGADALYCNMEKPPRVGIETHAFSPNLIDPDETLTKQGTYFKVFTPFYRSARVLLEKPLGVPSWTSGKLKSEAFPAEQSHLDAYWTPGEAAARLRLSQFVKKGLSSYSKTRDRIDMDGTSCLSPHLNWGELSMNEVWQATNGSRAFTRELMFREFANYLLYHFPKLRTENFDPKFNRFKWEDNPGYFSAWKKGKTGYRIVDAAMRELEETGWIHNRARMIVGSFLVKDLLVDWRKGERWFWEKLVDGDEALNAFNWQWVAGSGPDSAPYFRIFNPELQAKKFDPKAAYRDEWAPDQLNPIVDHNEARERALKKYK